MKKTLQIAVAIFLMLMLMAGAYFFYADIVSRPTARLATENFALVKNGLTQTEVEALLGGPPGNFGRYANGGFMTLEGYLSPPGSIELIWCDDNNRFEIYFDQQKRVVGYHRRAGYSQGGQEGFFAWCRRQLPW